MYRAFSASTMDDKALLQPVPSVQSTSPFLSLTTELKQAIFSALSNASDLPSLVLTCSSFYHTFLNVESRIIRSVLNTQIGSDLIHDAMAANKSTLVTNFSEEAAIELLTLYAKQDLTCVSRVWKLRDALVISELHNNIEYFSRAFASSALSTDTVTRMDEASPSPLSLLESNRIKRVFYRYELYWNIFRGANIEIAQLAPGGAQSKFFSMCAPWENEQLACVRDYLHMRLSLPFNDVAEHDVEWGSRIASHLDDWGERHNVLKERYLSLGLRFLRQVVDASTYADRCHLLKPYEGYKYRPLYHALKAQGLANTIPDLDHYTEEDERVYIPAQLATDSNKGPEMAWRWAHATRANAYWYNQGDQFSVRQWGYVMWDSARLVKWGLLDHPWSDSPREYVGLDEHCRQEAAVRVSLEARSKIFRSGGQGWWSAGDESRIIWTTT